MRLGLSAEEFFALTPGLFVALREEWLKSQWERAQLVALLRTDVINFSMGRPKDPVKVTDLLPAWRSQRSAGAGRGPVRLDKEGRREIADSFRRAMALYGVVEAPEVADAPKG